MKTFMTWLWATALAVSASHASAACNVALTDADIDRIVAVALGSEYGVQTDRVIKWTSDIRIRVEGDPNPSDLRVLRGVIAELNALIAPLRMDLAEARPNVRLHFAPEESFPKLLRDYRRGNSGFVSVWWSGDHRITKATVLISTTASLLERAHLIREELTQMLGLLNDLSDDPTSIFYQPWSTTQKFNASDTRVVRGLYCGDVRLNMTAARLRAALRPNGAPLGVEDLAGLRELLVKAGHKIDRAGGNLDAKTRAAVEAEQRSRQLFVDGIPNRGLLEALRNGRQGG